MCSKAIHAGCESKARPCSLLYEPFFAGSEDPIVKPLFVFINPKSGGQQVNVVGAWEH